MYARRIRHTHTGGAGDRRGERPAVEQLLDILDHRKGLLPDLREMALIAGINQLSVVDQNDFCGRGADIDAQQQMVRCSVFGVVDVHFFASTISYFNNQL